MKKATVLLVLAVFIFLLISVNSVGAEEYIVKTWAQDKALFGYKWSQWITYDPELSVICLYKSSGNYPEMMTCWDAASAPENIKRIVSQSRK